jgi:glucokinase
VNIGIDIGGTAIKGGLVDEKGAIIYTKEIPTQSKEGYGVVLSNIYSLIESLMEIAKTYERKPGFIGLGIPGLADKKSDYVIFCTNLGWNNVPLGIDLKKKFGLPVIIENDATIAGFAESICGLTKNYENSVFLTLGTGIGAGLVINNKIFSGSHGVGSEVGHMIIGENFYNCSCGKNGCFETFASATALIKYVENQINGGRQTILSGVPNIGAKEIFEAAKQGDELAKETISRFIKYLSIGIVNIINIMDPEIIAIGGGMSKGLADILSDIHDEVARLAHYKTLPYGKIVISELGNEAGIIGAAMLS